MINIPDVLSPLIPPKYPEEQKLHNFKMHFKINRHFMQNLI